MGGGTALYLVLFAVTNIVFFGILTAFLVITSRQQRRLKNLSQHLEDLIDELHTTEPSLLGRRNEGGGEEDAETGDSGAGQA